MADNSVSKENLIQFLKSRGYVHTISDENGLNAALNNPVTLYQGFDPSGDSLHLGHLLCLMVLHHMQEAGHKILFLVGGATGMVGDPEGKSTQRKLLSLETVKNNAIAIKQQVESMGLLKFSGQNAAVVVNNYDWLGKFNFLEDFMINVSRFFSVNDMVKMRTFEDRLTQAKPLSLFEFCYPAMQAWDFLYLYDTHKCTLQLGGQDQWANILAGVELVRKAREGSQVFALTFPLLTTSDGVKMGKTEQGPVWLDAKKTSPYDFYQYLIKTPDDMVEDLLKMFTFLSLPEIAEITKGDPKEAQKRLAYEVTKLVHGEDAAVQAMQATNIPVFDLKGQKLTIQDILIKSGCLSSNSEVRRRIEQKGISIDDILVTDSQLLVEKACIVKYGKGKLLKIVL